MDMEKGLLVALLFLCCLCGCQSRHNLTFHEEILHIPCSWIAVTDEPGGFGGSGRTGWSGGAMYPGVRPEDNVIPTNGFRVKRQVGGVGGMCKIPASQVPRTIDELISEEPSTPGAGILSVMFYPAQTKNKTQNKVKINFQGQDGTSPSAFVRNNYPTLDYPSRKSACKGVLLDKDMCLTQRQSDLIKQYNSIDGRGRRRMKRKVVRPLAYRWRNNTVPFEIVTGDFNGPERSILLASMAVWERHTCIKFRPSSTSDKDVLVFKGGEGCYSRVGRFGGRQDLVLAKSNCRKKKVVMHELGHALGLSHEHQRADRDNHVKINLENVRPGFKDQFSQISSKLVSVTGTKYDYTSLMHYGKTFFSVDGKKITIQTLDPEYQDIIGRVETLSFTDIKAINTLFRCSDSCTYKVKCLNGGYLGPDCKCWCPPSVSVCQSTSTLDYAPFNYNYMQPQAVAAARFKDSHLHATHVDPVINPPKMGQILEVKALESLGRGPQPPAKQFVWDPSRGGRWNMDHMLSSEGVQRRNNKKAVESATRAKLMNNLKYYKNIRNSKVISPQTRGALDIIQSTLRNQKRRTGSSAKSSKRTNRVRQQLPPTWPTRPVAVKHVRENVQVRTPKKKTVSIRIRTIGNKAKTNQVHSTGALGIQWPQSKLYAINGPKKAGLTSVVQHSKRPKPSPLLKYIGTKIQYVQPKVQRRIKHNPNVLDSAIAKARNPEESMKRALLREFQKFRASTETSKFAYALLKIPKEQAQKLLKEPLKLRTSGSGDMKNNHKGLLLTLPVEAVPVSQLSSKKKSPPPVDTFFSRNLVVEKPVPYIDGPVRYRECRDQMHCVLANPMSCWSSFMSINCPWSCGFC